ncbi:hypothetical protein SAMN04487960_106281 [Marinobacter mobilis]|uniref:Uncharacterized protein n=1 Tax=Marinobacter mobilis TaxID=488533 RepID=A0A1H2ZDF3_9GAMM|nr:hypothetical protein SAMN04487960_106281 [Marinobacter mobilis]
MAYETVHLPTAQDKSSKRIAPGMLFSPLRLPIAFLFAVPRLVILTFPTISTTPYGPGRDPLASFGR